MNTNANKRKKAFNEAELLLLSKEELISKIRSLNAHNEQLKSIISKNAERETQGRTTRPFDFEKCVFRHIFIKILYLGWNYNGFTVQEDTNETIEHYLFQALHKTCLIKSREDSNYHRCGRTDKGVSSFNQVISIDVRSRLSVENRHILNEEIDYCSTLNRVLPDDIQCTAWSPVETNFSARFDCKGRTYKYFFPKAKLDIEKMQMASRDLIGSHDFRNFCKMDVGNGVTQFIRSITSIEISIFDKTLKDIDEYSIYVITITGQAYLWHQIRCIMGILFLIGESKEEIDIIKSLLDVENNPRKPTYDMANEIPLNLYDCTYGSDHVNWQYNCDVVDKVIENLNRKYIFNTIQGSMIKSMIDDLKCKVDQNTSSSLSQFLIQGVKRKVYTPIMQRQKCDSLEEKIKSFSKRNKTEIDVNHER